MRCQIPSGLMMVNVSIVLVVQVLAVAALNRFHQGMQRNTDRYLDSVYCGAKFG